MTNRKRSTSMPPTRSTGGDGSTSQSPEPTRRSSRDLGLEGLDFDEQESRLSVGGDVDRSTRIDETTEPIVSDVGSTTKRKAKQRDVEKEDGGEKGEKEKEKDEKRDERPEPELHDLMSLPLGALDAHANAHADWHRQVPPRARAPIRALLRWARANGPVLAACAAFKGVELLPCLGSDAARFLEAYGRAVQRLTVPLKVTDSVEQALQRGEQVARIEGLGIPGPQLARLFEWWSLPNLMEKGHVDRFIAYVAKCSPDLQTLGGFELSTFSLCLEDGVDPCALFDKPFARRVKNLHRLSGSVLKILSDHDKLGGELPIALVVQAGADHNSAFHRSKAMTHVIEKLAETGHRVVFIEGRGSLSEAQACIAELPEGRVKQVILAGHGQARTVDLGAVTGKPEELKPHEGGSSEAFVTTLLAKLGDDAHVVLSACLTSSYDLPPFDNVDVDLMKAKLCAHIETNPPLRETLERMLAEKRATVHGANGSTTCDADLWDAKGGHVTLDDPNQPDLCGDKADYAATGREVVGVWRALLGLWARDDKTFTRSKAVVERRLSEEPGKGTLIGDLLLLQFGLIKQHNLFASVFALDSLCSLASGCATLLGATVTTVGQVWASGFKQHYWFYKEHADFMLKQSEKDLNMRMLLTNVIANTQHFPNGFALFCDMLEPVDVSTALRMIDLDPFVMPAAKVGELMVGDATIQRLVLAGAALLGPFHAPIATPCARWLQTFVRDGSLASPNGIDYQKLLGGFPLSLLEETVLRLCGEPVKQPDNLATDDSERGAPNTRVRSVTKRGRARAGCLLSASPLAKAEQPVDEGTDLEILGETDHHFALEWEDGVRFVARDLVSLD